MAKSVPTITLCNPGPYSDLLMATACFGELKARGFRIKFITTPLGESLFRFHPDIDQLISLEDFSEEVIVRADKDTGGSKRRIMLTRPDPLTRITHHFCKLAGVPPSDALSVAILEEHSSWGAQFKDSVVLSIDSQASAYREWPMHRWEEMAQQIHHHFGLKVVQLKTGMTREIPGIKKVEAPSILHAIGGLRRAFYFIGVDNLFNHASQALQKPVVLIWGNTHPRISGYPQNINLVNNVIWQPERSDFEGGSLEPTLRCQPCQFNVPGYTDPNDSPESYRLPKEPISDTRCPNLVPTIQKSPAVRNHPHKMPACLASTSVDSVLSQIAPRMIQKRPALEMRFEFSKIFQNNLWRGTVSASGQGSDLYATTAIREHLPEILRKYEVRTLLDAPCGEIFWILHLEADLEKYIGCDIVSGITEKNQYRYANQWRTFLTLDVTQDPLPEADMMMSRDLLAHLPFAHITQYLRNLKNSRIPYALITTFPENMENQDIRKPGEYRPVNLERPPFNLPPPCELFEETSIPDNPFGTKYMGLWRREDLPDL